MKQLMQWIHSAICGFATVALLLMATSQHITKNQFLLALTVYIYMVLLLIALFKEE